MRSSQLLQTYVRDISEKSKIVEAIEKACTDEALSDVKIDEIPFSSERKFSACIYKDFALVLGAPEVLIVPPLLEEIKKSASLYSVVVFGKVDGHIEKHEDIAKRFIPLCTIALEDPIREDAPDTIRELKKNAIDYRILSGDTIETVETIAKKVDPEGEQKAISGETLKTLSKNAFDKAVLEHTIFARVSPSQKKDIVSVLKQNFFFTAMLGDGVNDVLALKEADLGVVMNGKSSMAKDIADVVLFNNSFTTLPALLFEGRKIIANIQTIANIYLIKNISSIATIMILGYIGLRFPFDPKQVALSSFLIVGIPSFLLAFDTHSFSVTQKGFMRKLIYFTSTVGFCNALAMTTLYTFSDLYNDNILFTRSMLFLLVVFLGINDIVLIYMQHYTLREICKNKIVVFLISIIFSLFLLSIVVSGLRSFFVIATISPFYFLLTFLFALFSSIVIAIVLKILKLISFSL